MSELTIPDGRPRLVIGLDFGTTWSGFVGLTSTSKYLQYLTNLVLHGEWKTPQVI